jgi:hypothetical protein
VSKAGSRRSASLTTRSAPNGKSVRAVRN